MKVINISVLTDKIIRLGRRGEGNVRQIVFDCTCFEETYGSGTAQLLHWRRGDEAPYPVLIEQNDNIVTWTVQESDTANVGIGEAEIIWMLPDGNAKSAVYETETLRSLSEPGDPPEPWQAWVDEVLKAAESGGATPEQIAGAVERYLAEHPIEETDPTVPQWAKQPEKPSYTAEEVGALPAGTKIPSKMSDLQNDSKFTTLELDETLTDNTKAAPAGMVGELKSDLNDLRSEFESGSVGGGSGVSKAMAQTLDAVVRAWAYESPSFATSQEYADFKNAWGIDGSDIPVNPPEADISASFSGGVLTISGVSTITNKSFTNGILSLS